MLTAAFRLLRWPPDAVWRTTPRELAFALAGPAGERLRRDDLADLMARFPDLTE